MVAQALACDKSSRNGKISAVSSTGRPAQGQTNEKPGRRVGESVLREFASKPAAPGLWFCNWKIWLEARRRLDLVLDSLQLRAREFWLLALAGPGNVSQHEIAELCGLDPSSLVAVLDSMERRGWLRRRRNPRDRRIQWVQRTQAGDRLFSRALPLAQQAEAQQLAVLSAARQRQLVAAMGKLVMSSK